MNKSALKSPLSSLDPPLSQAPSSEDLSTPSADEARQLTSAIDRLVGRGCSELDLLTDSAEARELFQQILKLKRPLLPLHAASLVIAVSVVLIIQFIIPSGLDMIRKEQEQERRKSAKQTRRNSLMRYSESPVSSPVSKEPSVPAMESI